MPISIIVDDDTPVPSEPGVTLGDLIEDVLSVTQGFTANNDALTSLIAPVAATDTTLRVADTSGVQAGLIEIGTELIWVTGFDGNDLKVLPRGRGFRGTTATSHSEGETVVISPVFPRSAVVRSLNNQLSDLYPSLFAVRESTFVLDNMTQAAWELPADASAVLDVRFKDIEGNWQRSRKWEAEFTPDAVPVVRITDVPLSRDVMVVYGSRPGSLDAETALLSSTGLPASVRTLLVAGALKDLLPAIDVARLSVQTVAAGEATDGRQLGSASALADQYAKTYAQRLQEEITAFGKQYPAKVHFTR